MFKKDILDLKINYSKIFSGRRCSKELVKITATKCKLDHDEECTTETKVGTLCIVTNNCNSL